MNELTKLASPHFAMRACALLADVPVVALVLPTRTLLATGQLLQKVVQAGAYVGVDLGVIEGTARIVASTFQVNCVANFPNLDASVVCIPLSGGAGRQLYVEAVASGIDGNVTRSICYGQVCER
jgi:hypothetical protein